MLEGKHLYEFGPFRLDPAEQLDALEKDHSDGRIAALFLDNKSQAAKSIFVIEGGSCFSCSFPSLLIFANS